MIYSKLLEATVLIPAIALSVVLLYFGEMNSLERGLLWWLLVGIPLILWFGNPPPLRKRKQKHMNEIQNVSNDSASIAKKCEVFVDDNFHYMDESERYSLGKYDSLEEARERCMQIVDDYLASAYRPGMTADELMASYLHFGEDPWILCVNDPVVHFSARDYARNRCTNICNDRYDNENV